MIYKIIYTSSAHLFRPLYIETIMPEEELEGVICALQYFYEVLHDLEPLSDEEHLLRRSCLSRILVDFYDVKDVTNRYDSLAAGAEIGNREYISAQSTSINGISEIVSIDWYESLDFWGWSVSSRYDCMKKYLPRDRGIYRQIRELLHEEPL